ncbi:unnamed protein product, partial [Ilex paraguariensis]
RSAVGDGAVTVERREAVVVERRGAVVDGEKCSDQRLSLEEREKEREGAALKLIEEEE